MTAAYTADDLLTRVKARGQIPSADSRLSDADILAIADDATRSTLGRIVHNSDDGRWVAAASDQSITADQARYRIPSRALGGDLYDVLIVDSSGTERSSTYVDPSEKWRFELGTVSAARDVYSHTIEGDAVVLLPTPTTTANTLRIRYRRRPSRLVTVAECASISSLTASALTVASVPSTWDAAETIDVVEGTPQADALEDDVAVNISGTTLTRASGSFATSGADAIAASDYACLAGETCVPQIPEVAFPFLVLLTTYEVLAVLGDTQGMAAIERLLSTRKTEVEALLAERNRERHAVIQRYSHLRSGGRRRWGWGAT